MHVIFLKLCDTQKAYHGPRYGKSHALLHAQVQEASQHTCIAGSAHSGGSGLVYTDEEEPPEFSKDTYLRGYPVIPSIPGNSRVQT